MAELDVFKIFKDLELKAVGLDEKTNQMQEGYFVAFRSIGLPIHFDDYENPFSPVGGNLEEALNKAIKQTEAVDPKDAPKTGSGSIDISKAFVAGVDKSMQSYLNTYVLVNNKLQMNNQYAVMPGASHLDDTWYAIITGANGIPPSTELSDAMKQEYTAAQAKLGDQDGNMTPHYENYRKFRAAYEKMVKARNTAFAAAFTDANKAQLWVTQDGKPFQDDVDSAWDDWMGFGFKMEIEQAMATLAAQGTDPAIALIARAKKRFENSLITFPSYGEIPYTMLSPGSWYDKDNDDGWNKYTMNDYHSSGNYSASQTAMGASVSVDVGLWSGGASFEKDDSHVSSNQEVKNLKIEFDYAIVDIDRPWLDTSLLNLDNWFLVGDYKKNCISTGKMNQEKPTDGTEPLFLPSVVTSLIIIKNVSISWDDWKNQWAANTSSLSTSFSAGCCFVSASAHYSHATQDREFTCDDTGESLVIPGIQVIGYVSQILPGCPQKNSAPFEKKTNP